MSTNAENNGDARAEDLQQEQASVIGKLEDSVHVYRICAIFLALSLKKQVGFRDTKKAVETFVRDDNHVAHALQNPIDKSQIPEEKIRASTPRVRDTVYSILNKLHEVLTEPKTHESRDFNFAQTSRTIREFKIQRE